MPEATKGRAPRIVLGSDYGDRDPEWMKVNWHKHLHRIDLPGAEVVYAEIGEGETILFMHGLAGCWRNWLENLPHFGHTHRAIALDLPGFGDSPVPAWKVGIPAYGRLIHDFCEKLGIDRVAALVGNSLGGFRRHRGNGRTPRALQATRAGVRCRDQLREGPRDAHRADCEDLGGRSPVGRWSSAVMVPPPARAQGRLWQGAL